MNEQTEESGCTASSESNNLQHAYCALFEENLKLRQALNDVIITNHRWQSYNQERSSQLKLILHSVAMLRKERSLLQQQLELLNHQVTAYKEDWESERRERLKLQKEYEVARTLIQKLNEDVWSLKTAGNRGLLVPRTMSSSAHPGTLEGLAHGGSQGGQLQSQNLT